jgi:hypothetical protein
MLNRPITFSPTAGTSGPAHYDKSIATKQIAHAFERTAPKRHTEPR